MAFRQPDAATLPRNALIIGDRREEQGSGELLAHVYPGTGAVTREFRMALQTRLRDEGFYNGPIDGSFGQTTQAAITAYFNRNEH